MPYHLGMNCKEYKDRALQKYLYFYIENVAIAPNPSQRRTSSRPTNVLWPISAMPKNAKNQLNKPAQKSIHAVTPVSAIEEKPNACPASARNAQKPIKKHSKM